MERVPLSALFILFFFFCSFDKLLAHPVSDSITIDSVRFLLRSLGGEMGVKALGASGTLIQILIRVLQSSIADGFFQKQKPWVRLAMISALTFAVTPLGLMSVGGVSLAAALMHTTTLNAFMVFLDQLIKHAPRKNKDGQGSPSVRDSSQENDRPRRAS